MIRELELRQTHSRKDDEIAVLIRSTTMMNAYSIYLSRRISYRREVSYGEFTYGVYKGHIGCLASHIKAI